MSTDYPQEKWNEILKANSAYRNGKPFLTDTEYDNLVDSFVDSVGQETFDKMRMELTEDSGKVKHPYVMGSLDKVKAFDDEAPISKWILSTVPNTDSESDGLFISSKIDGCSVRLSYVDGRLVGASTRGNGTFGVNILDKAMLFIKSELDVGFTGDIRGEITLTKGTCEELSEFNPKRNYKNLRNGTAGLINGKDITPEEISFLRFFAYEIMGESGLSKDKQFSKLKKMGFETALYQKLTDIYNPTFSYEGHHIDEVLMKVYNEFLQNAPFDIDGLVVSDLNDESVFENTFIPKRTIAVKFNQMTADTRLIDVMWNVSKSGRLSPVGIIDSVELGGASVSNVTLNNMRIIKEQGLAYGCTVTVLKSGDVIPKIVGVRHDHPEEEVPIEYPKVCPSCGGILTYDDDALFPRCTNKMCDDVVHAKVLHFLRQLEIKHVSLKTIAKFGIRGISDLVNLTPDGGAVKAKFHEELFSKMFGADRIKLMSAFDYDGVSSQIIGRIFEHYGYERMTNSSFDELVKDLPHGVGEKFLAKFCEGFKDIRSDFESILSDSRYHGESTDSSSFSRNVTDGPLQGKGFVVTGALDSMSRDGFKKTVVENGGIYQSSVSKKTNYLVCNDISSATSKVKKAESLGVMVISEQKFLSMIREGMDGFAIF